MNAIHDVKQPMDDVVSLKGRALAFDRATSSSSAIAEFDFVAVETLTTTLEDRIGLVVDDGDVDGTTLATLGTLTDLVPAKLAD